MPLKGHVSSSSTTTTAAAAEAAVAGATVACIADSRR